LGNVSGVRRRPRRASSTRAVASALPRRTATKGAKQLGPAKVIRDSFTMSLADYELIGVLKKRCISLGIAIKKSELLRAGIAALDQLPDAGLREAALRIERIKTGRPPGKKRRRKKKHTKEAPR
jgi:hypothetical protein